MIRRAAPLLCAVLVAAGCGTDKRAAPGRRSVAGGKPREIPRGRVCCPDWNR
jgi:hypothetical protein